MITNIKKLKRDQSGQSLVLVALSLMVLLGFAAIAVDYGYLALQKRSLQNAADAAALAAAWELPDQTKVTTRAREYAKLNSPELIAAEILAVKQNSDKEVKVDVEHEYETFFAKALGSNSKKISATATAEKINPWWEGLLPFSNLNNYSSESDTEFPDFKTNIDDYSGFLKQKAKTGSYEIDFWEISGGGNSNYGNLYLETEQRVKTDPSDVLNRKYGNVLDIWGKDIAFDPGRMSDIENAHEGKTNGQTNLSDRLAKQNKKGYILAVLPDKIAETNSNGDKISKWGNYVILYLENIDINYDNKGHIIKDNPVTGVLKKVYNISAGEIPEFEFGNSGKSSRLIK